MHLKSYSFDLERIFCVDVQHSLALSRDDILRGLLVVAAAPIDRYAIDTVEPITQALWRDKHSTQALASTLYSTSAPRHMPPLIFHGGKERRNMPSTSPLTRANYASIIGYALYPVIFSALELVGINTLPSNAETSERYQTLVTPAGWAFAIWGVIFLTELIYVILQLHPRYRSHRMVRKGVHYWFFFVCMGQLFWSLSFGLNQIEMSTLFMAFILFCLVALEYCQYKTRSDGTKPEYWLLRFPFEVHTGWIVAAFAVNSNVAAVKWEASSSALFGLAIASIVYIIICAAISLFVLQKPNYAVPLTLSWATFGIAEELRSPMDSISRNFSESQIATIRNTSAVVCALLITCSAIRAFWKIRHGEREGHSGSTTGVAQEASMMGITSDPQGGLR